MRITICAAILLGSACLSMADAPEPRVDPRNVQVGGEIGRRIDITIHNNLLKLDAENDFLQPFRGRDRQSGYIGLGKLIDSLVRMAAYSPDEELMALKNHVIAETRKTQEPDGYIGLMIPEKRMGALWDIHEMTYIVNGLAADYRFFGNEASLKAARDLMDYIIQRWSAEPGLMDDTPITVFMAVTGLEETLLMLHEATGEAKYLDFCVNFRQLPSWDYPIDLGRWGKIGGHAYAFFHRCLAQLRLHQMEPDERLLSQTRKAMRFLTAEDGLAVNGVCGQHECWHDTQDGTEGLGETCATAYLIRVLDELIRMEGDSLHGDIMERAVFNGLFAAQSPDGRRLRYYVPFEGKREYFDGDTYCCPTNYRRIVAELTSMIYYRMDGGIAVNLYAESKAEIELEDGVSVKIRQETDYPSDGSVELTIDPDTPAAFPLRLRVPRWCERARIALNGSEAAFEAPGGAFYAIEREWRPGDRLTLEMPMPIRFVRGRKAQSGRVAAMRGPLVYTLNPERNPGMENADPREIVIDPDSAEGPFEDNTIRPGGTAIHVKAFEKLGFSTGGSGGLEIRLTEFPDPEGRMTYFKVRRFATAGVEDELVVNRF